jgi:gas vesicle protein
VTSRAGTQATLGHDEGEEMAENKCNRTDQVKGMVIAGVLGAIAGLLLAPSSGKKTFEDIKDKGEEAVGLSKRFYNEAKERADLILKEAYDGADKLKDEAERRIDEALGKVEEILAAAEKEAASMGKSLESIKESVKHEIH